MAIEYWYIASPYSHEDPRVEEERFRLVQDFCAELVKRDYHVFSPIAHWHPIAQRHNLPHEFEFWQNLDHTMIRASKGLIVLTLEGWHMSKGVLNEIQFANMIGKPIQFWAPF